MFIVYIITQVLSKVKTYFCQKERDRSPFRLFGYKVTNPGFALSGKSVNVFVCVYSFCLIYGHRLPCCPLVYSLPCRNHDWPIIKNTGTSLYAGEEVYGYAPTLIPTNTLYGGPGGSRTRVQNTFLFASYSNNFTRGVITLRRQPLQNQLRILLSHHS